MVNADAEVGVAVVGAGPHGLAATLALLDTDPSWRDDLVVIDPAGWMGTWRKQFARLRIDNLRSPGVHHPDPDPSALSRFCDGRPGAPGLPYGIPAADRFEAFCAAAVAEHDLDDVLVPCRAHRLVPGARRSILTLADGSTLAARHVVLAVNPARRRVPSWACTTEPIPTARLAHAADVDLRSVAVAGEHVVVVGGGLTAAHLAMGALESGALVTLVHRRPLRRSMFDTDPGWLGPKHLDTFHRLDDPAARLVACLQARDGGSIPPWMHDRLRRHERAGRLAVRTPSRVVGAHPCIDGVALTLDDPECGPDAVIEAGRVWLATGTAPDVGAHRLTRALLADHPTPVHGGFPVLDEHLRWPGTNVHLLGRPTMLALGPAAGNLWGARVGAQRVVARLGRRASTDHPSTGGVAGAGRLRPPRPSAGGGAAPGPPPWR